MKTKYLLIAIAALVVTTSPSHALTKAKAKAEAAVKAKADAAIKAEAEAEAAANAVAAANIVTQAAVAKAKWISAAAVWKIVGADDAAHRDRIKADVDAANTRDDIEAVDTEALAYFKKSHKADEAAQIYDAAKAAYVHARDALAALPDAQLGMTEQQVRETNWGEPDSVNRTTMVNHVREQWAYTDDDGTSRRFLYFDNGRLTAIQN